MQFDMIMKKSKLIVYNHNIDGLAGLQQKRRESISKAPELRLLHYVIDMRIIFVI